MPEVVEPELGQLRALHRTTRNAIGAATENLAAEAVRSSFVLATLDLPSQVFMDAGELRWQRLPAARRLADRNCIWRIAPFGNTLAPLRRMVP